jgi:hypothetical protein
LLSINSSVWRTWRCHSILSTTHNVSRRADSSSSAERGPR